MFFRNKYSQAPNPHNSTSPYVLISPSTDEEDSCANNQKMSHCKNGRNPSQPVRNHELPTTRAPVPRTYHHGNHRAPGYLPGVPRQSEPRIYRVPSLQRH